MTSEHFRLAALRKTQAERAAKTNEKVLAASRTGGTRAQQAATIGMSPAHFEKVLARARKASNPTDPVEKYLKGIK